MRFIFAMQNGDFGGTERITLHLIKGLQANGHECEVVTLRPMGTLQPYLEEMNLPWRSWDFSRYGGLPAFFQLLFYLRRSRADVLVQIAQRAITTLAIGLTPAKAKIQQCLHHHAGTHPSWMWRAHYALVSRVFDRITFLTRWCRDEAISISSEIEPQCEVLYPPVPQEAIKTPEQMLEARQKLGLDADITLLGALGRLVPVKRFDVFLETAAIIHKQRPAIRFLICGEGEELNALQRKAQDLGLAEAIVWLPWQRDINTVYRSLDALMFTTDYEAFGMVPCEAVAVGTPVVASVDNGGLDEVLPGCRSAKLGGHQPAQLAEDVLRLLDSKDEHLLLHDQRQRLAEMCSIRGYAEAFEALLP